MYFLQASQKRLLSNLNPLFVLVWIYVLVLCKSSAQPLLPEMIRKWDLLLPFCVYFGQRRPLPEGLLLTLLSGHLFSLNSSAPIGIFLSLYLILFFVARLLSYVLYANRWGSVVLLMGSLWVLSRFFMFGLASLFGEDWRVLMGAGFLGGFVVNTFLGLLIYWFLGIVDQLMFKTPRINIELAGREL